jgi:hypothetical protein
VPADYDDFWNTIDAAGAECRVVDAFGAVLTWGWSGFNKTNRTGTIRISAYTTGAAAIYQVFLYFGSTSAQGAGPSAPGAGGRNGYIELARPAGPYVVRHRPHLPGALTPNRTFPKTAAEEADLWVYYGGVLSRAWTPSNSSPLREDLYYVTQTVENNAGVDQTTMYDLTRVRFIWVRGEGTYVRLMVKAGTSGSVYTSSVLARLVGNSANIVRPTLDTRVGWRVRDVRLTA